jgi:tRNA(Ile)-lysidine synthetase-like protein
MPVIVERLGAGARAALLDVARHAEMEARAWDCVLDVLPDLTLEVSDRRFAVARAPLVRYDNVLAGRILRAVARRAGLRMGPRAARRLTAFAAAATSGRRAEPGDGLIGEIAFDRLAVTAADALPVAPAPLVLGPNEGCAAFGEVELAWRREPAPPHVPREGWSTWVADGEPPTVRSSAAGDRVRPVGGVGHRPVRRLLMEARIPRRARAAWPLVARGDDVLWVPGVCRGAAAIPAPGMVALRIDARTC